MSRTRKFKKSFDDFDEDSQKKKRDHERRKKKKIKSANRDQNYVVEEDEGPQ